MKRQIAIEARITGHVQGVAFRAWTRGVASKLGLTGTVRNQHDGSVLAMLIGAEDLVDEMITQLWSGPGAAEVQNVATHRLEQVPTGISAFTILR